jgi:ribosomal protein S17E
VKKSSRQVIERYYSKMTLDFHTNKKILEEVAIIPSKRLRNKIAGFSTHLMKRIQFIVNENWPKASALGERFQGKSNTSISSPCTGLVLARTKRISTQGFKNYLVYPPLTLHR